MENNDFFWIPFESKSPKVNCYEDTGVLKPSFADSNTCLSNDLQLRLSYCGKSPSCNFHTTLPFVPNWGCHNDIKQHVMT